MDCDFAKSQLGLFIDDELPPEVRGDLQAHLSGCFLCTEELAQLRELTSSLSTPAYPDTTPPAGQPPDQLWSSIEAGLDQAHAQQTRRRLLRFYKRPPAIAASIMLVISVGLIASLWSGDSTQAQASTVDFGVLLDALPFDANRAFQKFLMKHDAREVSPSEARSIAPELNFAIPDRLAGNYELDKVYALQFGPTRRGVAARYENNGKFLATIFHSPIEKEDYGSYQDHSCVVGKGHGHLVEVGDWRLVHLTDKTTCHCVLSQLDEKTELPAVMDAIAPQFVCNCGCQG